MGYRMWDLMAARKRKSLTQSSYANVPLIRASCGTAPSPSTLTKGFSLLKFPKSFNALTQHLSEIRVRFTLFRVLFTFKFRVFFRKRHVSRRVAPKAVRVSSRKFFRKVYKWSVSFVFLLILFLLLSRTTF